MFLFNRTCVNIENCVGTILQFFVAQSCDIAATLCATAGVGLGKTGDDLAFANDYIYSGAKSCELSGSA